MDTLVYRVTSGERFKTATNIHNGKVLVKDKKGSYKVALISGLKKV